MEAIGGNEPIFWQLFTILKNFGEFVFAKKSLHRLGSLTFTFIRIDDKSRDLAPLCLKKWWSALDGFRSN